MSHIYIASYIVIYIWSMIVLAGHIQMYMYKRWRPRGEKGVFHTCYDHWHRSSAQQTSSARSRLRGCEKPHHTTRTTHTHTPPAPRFGERSSCLSRTCLGKTDRFPQENWGERAACAPGDKGRGNRRRRRDGAATISSKASGGGGPG